MFHEISKTFAVLCLIGAFSGPASAAPTEEAMSDRQASSTGDAAGAKPVERAVAPEVSSGSRTVDMLIELQGKQVGLSFTAEERAAARTEPLAPKSDAAGRQAQVPGATVNRAGLFGSGAIPVAQPRESPQAGAREGEWRNGPAEPAAAGPAPNPSQRAYEAGRSHGDERLSLPRTVVAWIRENRSIVIGGALVILVAVGAASMGVAQRRR